MGLLEGVLNFFQGNGEAEGPAERLGRNDLCWCGSGKKYKKCHLFEDEKKQSRNPGMKCGKS